MSRFRRALGPIAAAWLLCQAATLTAAPVVFWLSPAGHLLECTCTHGDHAICPMHHKSAAGSNICLMRGADDDGLAVLTALLSSVGVVPAITDVVIPAPAHVVLAGDTTASSLRPAPPDPPPPRV